MSLLVKIARCPLVEQCLTSEQSHPCSKIVRSQEASSIAEFQVPEPWSGHIDKAPILFLSSNPSIGVTSPHQYPRVSWNDSTITEYFERRFSGSSLSSVANGIYDHLPSGVRSAKATRYWVGMRARAAELLGKTTRDVVPGEDYALTEVVRCKSRDEIGVAEAVRTCAGRYLESTLEASAARVIVVVGSPAATAVRDFYGIESRDALYGPVEIATSSRFVAFLPHPNSRAKAKTFSGCLDPGDLTRLKMWVASPS